MVDQLPCGSVLTPAISCTKFKIHSAHADSPMAETFFFSSSVSREDQSLLHRPRNSGREYAWWTNSLVGQYLHQLSLVQSSRSIQRMQTVPWPKRFFALQFLGRSSLCFADQETREENRHGEPTPLRVSTYTSYLLYKVQDPFSACRQSHGRNIFFLFRFHGGPVFASQTKKLRKRIGMVDQLPPGSVLTPAISCTKFKIYSAHADSPMAETFFFLLQFLGKTSLCFTDQETQEENTHGGPTPFWVSTYTSYLLYKVQDPFSACRQSHGRNIFFLFRFHGGPVFASQTKKLRKRIGMVDQLPPGSVLTPAISCTKFKIYSAHADSPMAETFFFLLQFLGKTSLCFTDQETQEENTHGGPTPFWVSTYTSFLLYKVQDPFSACRQSHGRNAFLLFSF